MVTSKMSKIITIFFSLNIFILVHSHASANDFNSWLLNFKNYAIKSGVSKEIVNDVMSEAKFLPKVIEYDRYQPEFYEDTFTYIKKRSSKKKVFQGKKIYKRPVIGEGDAKLSALIGSWLGIQGLFISIWFAFISAGIFVIIGLIFKKIKRNQKIPFGVFLALSGLLVWYFGNEIFLDIIFL